MAPPAANSGTFRVVLVISAAGITPDAQNLFVVENGLGGEVTAEEPARLKS